MRRRFWLSAIAAACAGSTAAATVALPAGATGLEAPSTEQIVEASTEALDAVGADGLRTDSFTLDAADASTGDGVVVDGDVVTFGAGVEGVAVSLPVTVHDVATVSENGTLVFNDAAGEGLSLEVQGIEGGSARLLTVAQEHYSADPVHEYAFDVALPEGAWLAEQADGTVAILQDADVALEGAEEVDPSILSGILPQPDALDGASTDDSASNVADEPSKDEASRDGPVVLASFAAPWSVDANGVELPTRYEVVGTSLVQVVDTTGAAFPVVSDPLPLVGIVLGAAARALAPHVIRAFAVQTIRAGAQFTIRGGYKTFDAFKKAAGTKQGYQWHHIVEQSAGVKRGWDMRGIHNPNNLVQIPTAVHQKCINSWMAKKGVRSFGAAASSSQTMRQWVHAQSFSKQHSVGVALLRHCGVSI